MLATSGPRSKTNVRHKQCEFASCNPRRKGSDHLIGRFLSSQWFLFTLAFALALGFFAPAGVIVAADSVYLRNTIVATVLFLMALPLLIDVVWRGIRQPRAACLSSFLNMALMPLIAWGLLNLLTGDLSVGLVLAAVVPSTMARHPSGRDEQAGMMPWR